MAFTNSNWFRKNWFETEQKIVLRKLDRLIFDEFWDRKLIYTVFKDQNIKKPKIRAISRQRDINWIIFLGKLVNLFFVQFKLCDEMGVVLLSGKNSY